MDVLRYPWDVEPGPIAVPERQDNAPPAKPKRRGRRPRSTASAASTTLQPAVDWLYHHLTISGPAEIVEAFAMAARGSGVTPWQLDFADLEEEVFVRAVSHPLGRSKLTVDGCRILARQFRQRAEARQARAAALVGRSRACPFDLHILLPVPDAILQLGPAHPSARAWLTAHWGVTDRLRQVTVRDKPMIGRRLPKRHTVIGYGFFTDGETPYAAVAQSAARWPALCFRLAPRPTD